jgi:hypothetical protein
MLLIRFIETFSMNNFGIYTETLFSKFLKIMMMQKKKETNITNTTLGVIKTSDIS